ncbi:uncharacterized protein F4807DRAFT_464973 [Annulohypoxylon truncatum]|uniref:uncharacterized protein n=1 Tax=Annulohypoxylon truncatum TaxID=327061 RepID=UPI0020074BF4|nr:uncharacterized protein F4807DRAFT_464973 [Annulohypoxylon truncatum]KAI1205156.1 hypothetical protein F4807DRAFT_464973 [Annulohypoxylon truncatum]
MDMKSQFLDLPYQVRKLIYHYYISVDGGYVYNPETGKLRTAHDGAIDLSLMYTCELVASEMKGLPLQTNTITFYPYYTEEALPFAYRNGITLLRTHHLIWQMFRSAERCYTEEVKSKFSEVYPQFISLFDDLRTDLRLESIGYPPSEVCEAMEYALKLASSHPDFAKDLAHLEYKWGDDTKEDANIFGKLCLGPWEVILANDTGHPDIFREFNSDPPKSMDITKYGFSAAALAVRFLDSIRMQAFNEIRDIILEENHPAVALSASHARGLIPFCRCNSLLRVERRVHLWKNIFLEGVFPRVCKYIPLCLPMRSIEVLDAHLSESMTRSVALWTMEALSLIPAGMPTESFSLVFHGDIMPEKCSEIFKNVIKRDATWQVAIEENIKLGLLQPFDFFRRPCCTFPFDIFKGFPQALEDIANKRTSIVRCDFDIGDYRTSDATKLAEERRKWTLDMWRLQWLDVGLIHWNDIPLLLEKIPLLKELVWDS